ncbi:MAG: N-acetylmuramoyl-L-alanine amidase [Candidatus Pelethousia sp.]|nr:N-acetylmuramoyl-L-alanine amidase [Candidatus Pelethousia sp.]
MALPAGILCIGDYGSDVSELQSELAAAGFYAGEISGTFTTDTRDALIALQKILGVEIDGIYGPSTAEAYEAAVEQGYFVEQGASEEALPLQGRLIGIDPGHQTVEDPALEPLLPGSNRTKARMTKGSVGVKTGVAECRVNLQIGLKLKGLLEDGGATVIMTRESNDVSLSNIERAQMMNQAGVDIWVRLHCDASSNEHQSGAHMLVPSRAYSTAIYKESLALAQSMLDSFCAATEAADNGISALMNQAGFNWSERPVVAIEMGFLSNAQEDVRLGRDSYQIACATGIYNGIVAYYQGK